MRFLGSHRIAILTFVVAVCLAREISSEPPDWKCKSGQLISLSDICDGTADCSDASDETSELCLPLNCPSFAFRCGYGACVTGSAKCNGVRDCADNSDETICSAWDYRTKTSQAPVTNKSDLKL